MQMERGRCLHWSWSVIEWWPRNIKINYPWDYWWFEYPYQGIHDWQDINLCSAMAMDNLYLSRKVLYTRVRIDVPAGFESSDDDTGAELNLAPATKSSNEVWRLLKLKKAMLSSRVQFASRNFWLVVKQFCCLVPMFIIVGAFVNGLKWLIDSWMVNFVPMFFLND